MTSQDGQKNIPKRTTLNHKGVALDFNRHKCLLNGSYPAFVKKDGKKTEKPLVDDATGYRLYWLSITFFPINSQGGQDVSIFAQCASKEPPIELGAGETPLVELVNPVIDLGGQGFSVYIDGVKRVKGDN